MALGRLAGLILFVWIGCLSFVQATPSTFEQNAQEQFDHFVKTIQAASGGFSQLTTDAKGHTQPLQKGNFSFQRPGKFIWIVQTPYTQSIVSDGKHVYQYDPDLMQVTKRVVNQAIGATPAAILFGSTNLKDLFKVSFLPTKEGLAWLSLKPHQADSGFAQIEIGFKNNKPLCIKLYDAFGQTTRIDLSNFNFHPKFSSNTFKFILPKGVDVVER